MSRDPAALDRVAETLIGAARFLESIEHDDLLGRAHQDYLRRAPKWLRLFAGKYRHEAEKARAKEERMHRPVSADEHVPRCG